MPNPSENTTQPLELPVIHLNGTSARQLRDGYAEAHLAVAEAIEKIEACDPTHSRDYYPSGPDAWKRAQEASRKRYMDLQRVKAEFLKLAAHAQNYIKD